MTKLVCRECGKIWYTADTSEEQKCGDCGGVLEEKNNID